MKPVHSLLIAALLLFPSIRSIAAAEVGAPAPECSLTSFDSSAPFPVKPGSNEVVYLDFWASWCGPCAKSFPFMNELHNKYKDKGLKIVAVNLDENVDDAKAFLNKIPADFAVAADSGSRCAELFEVKAMPSSYLIGRDGTIHYIHLGFRSGESEEVEKMVDRLLSERALAK